MIDSKYWKHIQELYNVEGENRNAYNWIFLAILIILIISGTINGKKYEKIQREILNSLGLIDWMKEPYYDICVTAINYEEFQKYSIDYFLEKSERRINNIASDIQKRWTFVKNTNIFGMQFLW